MDEKIAMNSTETIAAFIAETPLDRIPQEALQKSKWSIIDNLAVTLAGYSQIGDEIVAFVDELGGRPVSTIVGAGRKTSAPLAALANGTLSHALDYDDLNESMGGHPTGPVLAAILAVGEMVKSSGEELLPAYVLGVETETKIGRCLIETLYKVGWHPTAILGTLGATAACCKLLGLDTEKTLMALGIAGSFASGLKQNFGTLTKPLHVGQTAKNGVMAALLARKGWTADRNILEGQFGYCNLFCGPGNYDLKDMPASLGSPWEIIDPGIRLKKYPCCGSIHPALDAVFGLSESMAPPRGQIKRVDCCVYPSKTHILVHPRPATGLEAKFSLEYCLAAALVDGHLSLSHFSGKTIRRENINGLLGRIHVATDPSLPEWGSRVRIETDDGFIFASECLKLAGISTQADLRKKFFDCVVPMLDRKNAAQLFDTLLDFENIGNISDVVPLLIGGDLLKTINL
jgi:2-methylcitrate dehydratase PrpD